MTNLASVRYQELANALANALAEAERDINFLAPVATSPEEDRDLRVLEETANSLRDLILNLKTCQL